MPTPNSTINAYAGVGSRQTPPSALEAMERIGRRLAEAGWLLRSGAADGADSAFERGCVAAGGPREIYLPWSGFQNRTPQEPGVLLVPASIRAEAERIAAEAHPAWQWLKHGEKKLHTRNVCQVLGPDLASPCRVVICFTKRGRGQGGTGQALRVAKAAGIPVIDLGTPDLDLEAELAAVLQVA